MRAFDAAGSSSIANGALRDLAEDLMVLHAALDPKGTFTNEDAQEALFRLANKANAAAELDDALPMQRSKGILRKPPTSPPPTVPAAPKSGEEACRQGAR